MRKWLRADVASRILLTLGALLPYWRLLSFSVVFVSDDFFTSDIYNGELPGRVLIGQMLRRGEWPAWTSRLSSGFPLAGTGLDPIGLPLFTLLQPAPALDLLLVILLLIAAHGAYGLARRFGADRPGAVLAGLAFAGSGYFAGQLRHLSIVSTVVWLPVGLLLLDRAADPDASVTRARRSLFTAAFGLVFAAQVLAGFPQSVYICALVYAAFTVFRAIPYRAAFGNGAAGRLLVDIGAAAIAGAAAGAVALLPLAALAGVSDQAVPRGYEWTTSLGYWPRNVLTFFAPYINGDVSNGTYIGPSLFWEDYGYVGLATVLLAIYGGVRDRRKPAEMFLIAAAAAAYVCVLGRATPVFKAFYYGIPGVKMFRATTRFLIVVELALAVLGAIGLTRLRAHLQRRAGAASRLPQAVAIALCAATALDLFVHQPRQNPMVRAAAWLAAPSTVDVLRAGGEPPRTFTPRHMDLHARAYHAAKGWADLRPYFDLRDVLEPNIGAGYWNVPSVDGYTGIAPRWSVDVWGSHTRQNALVPPLAAYDFDSGTLAIAPLLPAILRAYGVTHVLSPYPQQGGALPLAGRTDHAYVYRVDGSARARVVRAARLVGSDEEAAACLQSPDFDPDREILLHDAPASVRPTMAEAGHGWSGGGLPSARIAHEDATHVVVEATAPDDGFLLLADTYFPGWTARVDGAPAPIYRADISVRGVPLAKGRHTVTFSFEAPGFVVGLWISAAAIVGLLVWFGVAVVRVGVGSCVNP